MKCFDSIRVPFKSFALLARLPLFKILHCFVSHFRPSRNFIVVSRVCVCCVCAVVDCQITINRSIDRAPITSTSMCAVVE